MKRLVGAFALVATTGCFDPGFRDAQLSCESSELCPAGFVCLGGVCRNEAPDGKGDDPTSDAGPVDSDDPDAGTPPDEGPKVYELANGTWNATAAEAFFAGSGLSSASITTAWSQCALGTSVRCFADNNRFACKKGAAWGSAPWSEIDFALSGFNATFSSAFVLEGPIWSFYTHRGEDWRGYDGFPLEVDGSQVRSRFTLQFVSGQNGVGDLDQIYGDDPNAPQAFDDIVADYIDRRLSRDPWSHLTATGYRYTILRDSLDSTGDQEPSLALPGAPRAQDIKAALMCDGKLMFYALN